MATLSDFSTLSEAQAYSEKGAKMVSPDMMVAFLVTFAIYRAVDAEDSEAAAGLRGALQFGSEFNFIEGHPDSVTPLLDKIDSATPEFKEHCVNYANPVTRPFAKATQADFDKAKLELNPTSVISQEISNGVLQHTVTIKITEPLSYKDTFSFTANSREGAADNFAVDARKRAYIVVGANEVGEFSTQLNKSGLKSLVQYVGSSTFDRNFEISVVETRA